MLFGIFGLSNSILRQYFWTETTKRSVCSISIFFIQLRVDSPLRITNERTQEKILERYKNGSSHCWSICHVQIFRFYFCPEGMDWMSARSYVAWTGCQPSRSDTVGNGREEQGHVEMVEIKFTRAKARKFCYNNFVRILHSIDFCISITNVIKFILRTDRKIKHKIQHIWSSY